MQQSTGPRLDARDYFRIAQKRKWFIILVALAAMLVGGLYAVSYPKSYKASSQLRVSQRPPGLVWLAPSAEGGGGSQQGQDDEISLETQAVMVTSGEVAKRVAEALRDRKNKERIVIEANEVQKSLTVGTMDPDRIRIEATSPIERNAIAFANETAEQFIEFITEVKRGDDKNARLYLEEQLKRTDRELERAQDEIAKFQMKAGVFAEDAGAGQTIQTLANYRAARDAAGAELAATRAQLDLVDNLLAQSAGNQVMEQPTPNPTAMALREQLTTAEVALGSLRARYYDGHPAVRQMQDQVGSLKSQIEQTPSTVSMPSVAATGGVLLSEQHALHLRIAEVNARLEALTAAVTRLESEANTLPEKISGLQRLKSRSLLLSAARERLMQELESRRLKEQAKGATARVLDYATVATSTSPSVSRGLLFSGVLGLVAGIALALLLEALDDTIHTPEQMMRETGVSFLGMVPMLEEGVEELITVSAPKSPPAETYRTLRSNINFALVEDPARRFLITSSGAGEGKSITAANLAVVFAQAGQSVILCDTDLRRPSLHRVFHAESTRGLTNVLVGEASLDEVLQDTHVEGLRLLATGPLPPNPAEMLDSAALRRLIDELLNYADIVLFDSPPAIVLTDASILASKIERTILVAEAGQVTREAFTEAVRLIENARGRILGCVLNKLRLTAGDYYYYYYYYDYSRETPRVAPPTPPGEEE